MSKHILFASLFGLIFTCSFAQSKPTEYRGHQPTLTATSTRQAPLEEQVKQLELRLEKLKLRQPAPSAEELQKMEMYLAKKREALAAERASKARKGEKK